MSARVEIQAAIEELDRPLREALLLTTRHSRSKCAEMIGESREIVAYRVSEAKRRVADEVLGTEQDDPDSRRVLGMYIDGVAMRMQRRRESSWQQMVSWVHKMASWVTVGGLLRRRESDIAGVAFGEPALAAVSMVVIAAAITAIDWQRGWAGYEAVRESLGFAEDSQGGQQDLRPGLTSLSASTVPYGRAVVRVVARRPCRHRPESLCDEYGSGFFVNERHIVTASHVVREAESVSIVFPRTKRKLEVTVRADHPARDLDVLQYSGRDEHEVLVVASGNEAVIMTDRIHVVGYSAEAAVLNSTADATDVARINVVPGNVTQEPVEGQWSETGRAVLVLHDAAVDEGTSGGPVVDECNQVVAVNSLRSGSTTYAAIHVSELADTLTAEGVAYTARSCVARPEERRDVQELAERVAALAPQAPGGSGAAREWVPVVVAAVLLLGMTFVLVRFLVDAGHSVGATLAALAGGAVFVVLGGPLAILDTSDSVRNGLAGDAPDATVAGASTGPREIPAASPDRTSGPVVGDADGLAAPSPLEPAPGRTSGPALRGLRGLLGEFGESLDSDVLAPDFDREAWRDSIGEATSVSGLRRALLDLEFGMTWEAVHPRWRDEREDWGENVLAASSYEELAVWVALLESRTLWEAVSEAWRERRPGWFDDLAGVAEG